MLCNNKFTLKQIDILRCFNVTLIQIDISIWYKVAFFTVLGVSEHSSSLLLWSIIQDTKSSPAASPVASAPSSCQNSFWCVCESSPVWSAGAIGRCVVIIYRWRVWLMWLITWPIMWLVIWLTKWLIMWLVMGLIMWLIMWLNNTRATRSILLCPTASSTCLICFASACK